MAIAPQLEARVGAVLEWVARVLAWIGGMILVAIALITVASITGRALISLGLSPITGDFELVEAGCAIAIFCFLPWCQLRRGHVTVDVLVARFPARVQAFFGFLGDVLIALASGVILWRIWLGLGEKFPYGGEPLRGLLGFGTPPFFVETTYELEVPIWIPYAAATAGAAVFFVVALYTVWRSLNWTLAGAEGRA
ncbi:MAG: TRAP transporter small permease [Pseudomonadota bacterium]